MFLRLMVMGSIAGVLRAPEGAVGGGGGGGTASGGASGGSSAPSSSSGGSTSSAAPGGSASPATSGTSTSSSGAPASSSPAEGAGNAGNDATPEGPKWPKAKFKAKRGGAELELDVETAYRMLGDDYEHEIPLGGDKKGKFKWNEIERRVQRSEGAEELMRKAASLRKEHEEQVAFARQNPDWGLQALLGIEDPDKWASDHLMKRIEDEAMLKKLAQTDESAFFAEMEKRAADKLARKNAFAEQKRQLAEQQAKAAENEKRGRAVIEAALKEAGMPVNARMERHVLKAISDLQELGYRPPNLVADVVAAASKAYQEESFGWLDEVPDERILELLGPDRRKRLRELELAIVSGGGAPKKEKTEAPREARKRESTEISEAEFRKRYSS